MIDARSEGVIFKQEILCFSLKVADIFHMCATHLVITSLLFRFFQLYMDSNSIPKLRDRKSLSLQGCSFFWNNFATIGKTY